MMSKLVFDDLKELFCKGTIWMNKNELFWYEHAWNSLAERGKAEYETNGEYYRLLLRAVSLVKAYLEFSALAFGQEEDTDFSDLIDGEIPPLVIGQILAGIVGEDELYEEEEDALRIVLNSMKYEVFKDLRKEMSVADIFVWMYCTGDDSYFYHDAECEDGEEFDDEITDIESFEEAVRGAYDSVLNDNAGGSADAYYYVECLTCE